MRFATSPIHGVDGDHRVIRLVGDRARVYDRGMPSPNIVFALRIAVTATALATTYAGYRSLFRDADRAMTRRAGMVLASIAAVAVLASHTTAGADVLPRIVPLGLVLGLGLVAASLGSPALRGAFDRLRDGDVRMLVGTRAAFGAMLLGFGALGVLPASFALSAGLGDVLVGAAVIGAPGTFDRSGSRAVRAIVHGIGFVDMMMVIAEAILVVRPWSFAHPGLVTSMTLPWLIVPFMVAMDLHGLRKVVTSQIVHEPVGHGSESARRVRSAVS